MKCSQTIRDPSPPVTEHQALCQMRARVPRPRGSLATGVWDLCRQPPACLSVPSRLGRGSSAQPSPRPAPQPLTPVSAAVDPGQEEILCFTKAPGDAELPGTAGKGLADGAGDGPGRLPHSGRARLGARLLKWEAGQGLLPKDPHQGTPEFRDRPQSIKESWVVRCPLGGPLSSQSSPPVMSQGPGHPLPPSRGNPPERPQGPPE